MDGGRQEVSIHLVHNSLGIKATLTVARNASITNVKAKVFASFPELQGLAADAFKLGVSEDDCFDIEFLPIGKSLQKAFRDFDENATYTLHLVPRDRSGSSRAQREPVPASRPGAIARESSQNSGVSVGPSSLSVPGASEFTSSTAVSSTTSDVSDHSPQAKYMLTKEELQRELERNIRTLIGDPSTWSSKSAEVKHFRETMRMLAEEQRTMVNESSMCGTPGTPASVDAAVLSPVSLSAAITAQMSTMSVSVSQSNTNLPVYLAAEPLSEELCKTSLFTKIHFPGLDMTKTWRLDDLSMSADDYVHFVVKKAAIFAKLKDPSAYLFKATGLAEYICGSHPLSQFEYVQICAKKKQFVELSLTDRELVQRSNQQQQQRIVSFAKGQRTIFLHKDIAYDSPNYLSASHLSIWDLHTPFRFRIWNGENILYSEAVQAALGRSTPEEVSLYVTAELVHGGESVAPMMISQLVPFNSFPRWNAWLECPDVLLCNLPEATVLCVTVWARPFRKEDSEMYRPNTKVDPKLLLRDAPVGWVNVQLVAFNECVQDGKLTMNLWPDERANPIGTCVGNIGSQNAASICLEFMRYGKPVVFPSDKPPFETAPPADGITPEEMAIVDNILLLDPLHILSSEEKVLLWKHRGYCTRHPKALAKFLAAVPWTDPAAVYDARQLLNAWAPMDSIDALALLDAEHSDPYVREYAVERLEDLPDEKLQDLVLQLSQVLKYEAHHDCPLVRYLLRRAVRTPHIIGHILFWRLKAEMHVAHVAERYGLILEEYLRNIGTEHLDDLLRQNYVLEKLKEVAYKIKDQGKTVQEKAELVRQQLAAIEFPPLFKLPLSPRLECKGIIVEKCKCMDSKKLPLWLVFQNADPVGNPIYVIFKAGDDLRQDQLTLQMLAIMDKMWKEAGLALHLIPYGCVSTGDGNGFIEIVQNAETTAAISKQAGGARAALRDEPIANWLRRFNRSDAEFRSAVTSFVQSCAAYCVATYVLGIGDRHNDNIMLQRTGTLFHIDFGHFLGNYKTFGGWKRETAPFVFTPDFCFVMGGQGSEDYKKFVNLCAQGYNAVRAKGDMFISLFKLMLSTGIPELQSASDICYMRDRLLIGKSNEVAALHFEKEIESSLKNKRLLINNVVHILAHPK